MRKNTTQVHLPAALPTHHQHHRLTQAVSKARTKHNPTKRAATAPTPVQVEMLASACVTPSARRVARAVVRAAARAAARRVVVRIQEPMVRKVVLDVQVEAQVVNQALLSQAVLNQALLNQALLNQALHNQLLMLVQLVNKLVKLPVKLVNKLVKMPLPLVKELVKLVNKLVKVPLPLVKVLVMPPRMPLCLVLAAGNVKTRHPPHRLRAAVTLKLAQNHHHPLHPLLPLTHPAQAAARHQAVPPRRPHWK